MNQSQQQKQQHNAEKNLFQEFTPINDKSWLMDDRILTNTNF